MFEIIGSTFVTGHRVILRSLFAITLLILTVCIYGCFNFSAPVRTSFGSMPETQGKGENKISAGYGYYVIHTIALQSYFGALEDLDVELGGWTEVESVYIGNAGIIYRVFQNPTFPISLSGGFGAGAEGVCDDCNTRLVIGGYGGFTLGWRATRLIGLYQGNRYQITYSKSSPATHYGHHVLGLQLDWSEFLSTNVESGYFYFGNSEGFVHGPSYVFASLSLRWPIRTAAKKPALSENER